MSEEKNKVADAAAFPGGKVSESSDENYGEPFNSGMTLRDYLAAKAMVSMGHSMSHYRNDNEMNKVIAKSAYRVADAMLQERKK